MNQQQPFLDHPPRLRQSRVCKGRRKTRQYLNSRRPKWVPLPLNPLGQRLSRIFTNGWDWIYASLPKPGEKPQWETVKRFPLTPVEMWQLHQNPNCLIGARPGSLTTWGVIDLDHLSPYHPQQDQAWLPIILSTLEAIGITRYLICQSSYSGGLHIYLPLPEPVSSFWLATTLQQHLQANGLKLRSGHCEIYPNPKRYIPQGQGFSKFAALRYPMQPGSGFLPLDADLNPLPWTLDQWLDAFDLCTTHQDIKQLNRAIKHSQENYRIRHYRHPQSLEAWQQRIEAEKQQGWTGPSQSNEKFKLFACEARVFLGMDSIEAIAHHIQASSQAAPGFNKYSNHVKDLEQRSREVATWAIRYYWPIGTPPKRETAYHGLQTAPADFGYHQAKQEAAQARIRTAVADLQTEGNLPDSITMRVKAIAKKARISQKTLYKRANKPLWHPDHFSFPVSVNEPQLPPKEEISQPVENETLKSCSKVLKVLWLVKITQLYIYVGFCLCMTLNLAFTALTLKGQKAVKAVAFPSNSLNRKPLESDSSLLNLSGSASVTGSIFSSYDRTQEYIRQQRELEASITPESRIAGLALVRQQIKAIQARKRERHNQKVLRVLSIEANPSSQSFDGCLSCEISPSNVPTSKSPPLELEAVAGDPSIPSDPPLQQELRLQEQADFSEWFSLAQQFGIVIDSEIEDGEIWVLTTTGGWELWTEVSAMFTPRRLRRYLELDTS